MSKVLPVVYHNLEQVIKTLRTSEIAKTSEVNQLFKVCSTPPNGILDPYTFHPKIRPVQILKPKLPVIVMEGLDGSGKTKVSTALSKELNLARICTPPDSIQFLKDFFDDQSEPIRRAYYSLGNYVVAQEIGNTRGLTGIMMDRYWHSTAAYGAARKCTDESDDNSVLPEDWFEWPGDLMKPQLAIFLVVSEKVRLYRHAYRNTTNTREEQTLATNLKFRETLIQCYKKIQGPELLEINADVEIEDITSCVRNILVERFPILLESKR